MEHYFYDAKEKKFVRYTLAKIHSTFFNVKTHKVYIFHRPHSGILDHFVETWKLIDYYQCYFTKRYKFKNGEMSIACEASGGAD